MPIDAEGKEYFYTSGPDGVPVVNYGAPPAAPQQTTGQQLTSLLAKYNPLMLRKSLQDASGTIAMGGVLPAVAPWSAGIQNVAAQPGILYRKYLGDEKSLQEAADIEKNLPTAEQLMQKYGQAIAPKTELGQEMVEGVGKTLQRLKVPDAWPVVPNTPRRPILTPEDVRVAAGQVKQTAREVRDIPTDFQNAQSGLKRQNLYGEDTVGVKLQSAADDVGRIMEERQLSGRQTVPGVPEILQPPSKMYAVRPSKSTLTRPKMTEGSEGFIPEVYGVEDVISDVYGDTPVAKMPSSMVMTEYAKRFLPSQGDLAPVREAVSKFTDQKIAEMYPDAPDLGSAKRAYNVAFTNREQQTAKGLEMVNEFFATPEGQAMKEQYGLPTPDEFMQRYGEAERVIKGPFANFISRNVGAEGDALTKLARKGITIEPAEQVNNLSNYVNKGDVAQKRVKAGFPAMGSFHEEHMAKTSELDALNDEIQKLEEARQPLFNQAHEQGIDPASIPEYAETTNPLRQKLRQREKLQEDLGNIKLAQNVETINDSIVKLKSTEEMLKEIPYEQRQFYPSVTRAQPGEMHYTAKGNFLKDSGFEKLGKDLVEDILTGKAGDTSKLTIENFIRDKHLTRVEAEKAAKLQEQAYRQNLEAVLVKRLRDDPSVETYGNAAVITLTKDTPKEVALRDMSTDTAILDHCVGQGGSAPSGRKNLLTGQQQYYEPIIDPVSGERNKNVSKTAETSYVRDLEHGSQLASVRDARTGLPAATLQFIPASDNGLFNIGYASGAKNGSIDMQYAPAIRDYLNNRAGLIKSSGSNLSDNTGVYDIQDANDWRRVTREAKLEEAQVRALQAQDDLPRFVTVEDVKKATEGFPVTTAVAVRNEAPVVRISEDDYPGIVNDYNSALENAAQDALENSGTINPTLVERHVYSIAEDIFGDHLNDMEGFLSEPNARLLRAERDLENHIARLHAQGTEYHGEVADALDNFLIDVRGIRGNVERRLRMAQERAAQAPAVQGEPMPGMSAHDLLEAHGDRLTEEQRQWLQDFDRRYEQLYQNVEDEAALVPLENEYDAWIQSQTLQAAGARQAPRIAQVQGEPMPEMSADELLTSHRNRLSEEQQRYLRDFSRRWELDVDETPAGATAQEQLTREYGDWLATNRLEPDPLANLFDDLVPDDTHPANNVALQQRPGGNQPTLDDAYRALAHLERTADLDIGGMTERDLAQLLRNNELDGILPNMTPEQRNNLANQVERDFSYVDYEASRNEAPEAPRQLPAGYTQLMMDTAEQYGLAPVTVRELDARFLGATMADLADMRDNARARRQGTIFGGMSAEEAQASARLITDTMQQRRAGEEAPRLPAPEAPQQSLAAQDIYDLSGQYDVPPGMVRAIITESNGPIDRLLELQNEAFTGAGRFETLPQSGRDGAVRLIRDLLTERQQQIRNERQQAAPQLPAQGAAYAAVIPREVQVMAAADLLGGMTRADQAAAARISRQYFDDNNFNNDHPISLATNSLRNYDLGLHQGANNYVREQAARNLERMYTAAQHDADSIAESLREVFYEDATGPEDAITQIERDIGMLRMRGEAAWEDLVGPMAEDMPWNPTLQQMVLDNLETIRDQFREQLNGYAKGGRVKKPVINLRKISGNPDLVETAYKYGGYVA